MSVVIVLVVTFLHVLENVSNKMGFGEGEGRPPWPLLALFWAGFPPCTVPSDRGCIISGLTEACLSCQPAERSFLSSRGVISCALDVACWVSQRRLELSTCLLYPGAPVRLSGHSGQTAEALTSPPSSRSPVLTKVCWCNCTALWSHVAPPPVLWPSRHASHHGYCL